MKRAAFLIGLLAVLLLPPAAEASYDPIGGGATRLVLSKRFAAFLGRSGVRLSPAAGATKRGRTVVFPVSGGSLDPTAGAGEIDHSGSLVLRSSRSRVRFRKLVVETAAAPLVAKVGGSQLKIATSAATDSERDGFATVFTARELKLTDKVATRLNKKLRPRQEFYAGQPIGTLVSEARPLLTAIVPIDRATLVFDQAFVAKLDQRFVAVNPVFPAEHVGATFTLPIVSGGALAPDASQGTLRTGGEIEFLRLGAGQVFWQELWFDIGLGTTLADVNLLPSPPFPGKLGQIGLLGLGGGLIDANPGSRAIGLNGVPLVLQPASAAIFNQAFAEGEEDFEPGELVGLLSFEAQAQ